jgi:hypothetical protein
LRRFQASFQWFFFFLLFHASMMSDLSVDVVDTHDAVVSEGHPVSDGDPQASSERSPRTWDRIIMHRFSLFA